MTCKKRFCLFTAIISAALMMLFLAMPAGAAGLSLDSSSLDISELTSSSTADYTIMVYICGSNLESIGGCAGDDIKEMINGYSGNRVNVILQTGGAKKWRSYDIPSDTSCRYRLTRKGLKLLDDTIGDLNTGSTDTLANFIKYCRRNYKARHYALILWDHGAGTLYGFGSDENHKKDQLDLVEFRKALEKGGTRFDFIGFDACVMATMENALVVSDYTPYLIAAEESEPGIGWYYTKWLRAVCNNPDMPTLRIGKNIANSTVTQILRYNANAVTNISVIDTRKVKSTLLPELNKLAAAGINALNAEKFHEIATARIDSEIYTTGYDLTDMHLLCECLQDCSYMESGAGKVDAAVKKCVAYNRKSMGRLDLCGISFAFPFDNIDRLDHLADIYKISGCSSKCTDFLSRFANIMAGGQIYSRNRTSSDFKKFKWYDSDKAYSKSYYSKYFLSDDDLTLKMKDGYPCLEIPPEKAAFLTSAEMGLVLYDPDNRYSVMYGTDNHFYDTAVTKDKKHYYIFIDYDQSWMNIQGIFVPNEFDYETYDDGYSITSSCIPCYYNDMLSYLFVIWNSRTRTGSVIAWAPMDDEGSTSRYYYIEDGDVIQPAYTFYDYKTKELLPDQVFEDNTIIVKGMTMKASYKKIRPGNSVPCAYLYVRDVFNNYYMSSFAAYMPDGIKLL